MKVTFLSDFDPHGAAIFALCALSARPGKQRRPVYTMVESAHLHPLHNE
jgi:hypothetical protein